MVTIIPSQLSAQKFIRLQFTNPDPQKQKSPAEKNWPTTNNYTFDEFYEEFPNDPMYGVLCGANNLMVVDCDDKETQDKLMQNPIFNETFTVKTAGKGLYHFYFKVKLREGETCRGVRGNNKQGKRIFDLQGDGTQVVGPNSKLQDGRKYEIVNPREIATIPYIELRTILDFLLPDTDILEGHEKAKRFLPDELRDPVCVAIQEKVPIEVILPEKFKHGVGVLGHCPRGHQSQGGQCFNYTKDKWFCFHCGKNGDVIELYKELKSVDFKTAKQELAKIAGLDKDFKMNVLQLYSDHKTRTMASEKLAKEIVKIFHIKTLRNDKSFEMWIYKNGIYVPNGISYIQEFIRDILGKVYNRRFVEEVVYKVSADTKIEMSEFMKGENTNLVPIMNGILNIKTRTIEPFSPKYTFFNKLPLIYDKEREPEKIKQFLTDIVKPEDVNLLQEFFGYLLHRDYIFEKAFLLIGQGRNGKGKLLRLMESFVGIENTMALSLQDLSTKGSFEIEHLFGKLVNLGGDIPKTKIKDTSMLRRLTGRDPVTANRKNKSAITFVNEAKFVFACNEVPEVGDSSEGYFDRWVKIDFPYKFVDNPTEPHHKQINVNILENLTTQQELSGLLNWALDGLDRLLKQEHFSETKENVITQETWTHLASSMSRFLDEMVEDGDEEDYITVAEFNSSYKKFCSKNRLQIDKMSARKDAMNSFGIIQQSTKLIENNKARIFPGIKFIGRDTPKEPEEEEINLEQLP